MVHFIMKYYFGFVNDLLNYSRRRKSFVCRHLRIVDVIGTDVAL